MAQRTAELSRTPGAFEAAQAPSVEHLVSHGPATTSLQDGQFRTLKHDDTFGVFDNSGDAVAGPGGSEGLYHCDTRHLSHFQLTVDGTQAKLLSDAALWAAWGNLTHTVRTGETSFRALHGVELRLVGLVDRPHVHLAHDALRRLVVGRAVALTGPLDALLGHDAQAVQFRSGHG